MDGAYNFDTGDVEYLSGVGSATYDGWSFGVATGTTDFARAEYIEFPTLMNQSGGRTIVANYSDDTGVQSFYMKSADGSEFKLKSFDISNLQGHRSKSLTIAGYRDGDLVVAAEPVDLASSDAVGNVTYTYQEVDDFGVYWGKLSFGAAFNNVDEVRLLFSADAVLGIDNVVVSPAVSGPTVSDAHISITSTGSGTAGVYKIGDTVTAAWDASASGDNAPGVSGVTMDFSAFGGGAAIAASNAGGVWTASYTIVSGAIDGAGRNVSVTADGVTRADTSNLVVDNVAPTVTDGRISISGGSGAGGAYKIGDTVTATWNNTAGGDNNSDTISSVTVDFSAFGGGSAVAASNSGGTWTATYTITSGAIDATNRNVAVTVTDNAGNVTTSADTSNATVDNVAPSVTFSSIALSADTGASGSDFVTNASAQTLTATLSGALGGGDVAYGSVDNGATWTDITSKVSGTTLTWTGVVLSGSNTIKLMVADAAGNSGTVASQAYTLDTTAPAAPSAPDLNAASDSGGSPSDDLTNDSTPTVSGTAEAGSTVTLYDTDGTTVLGTTTASGGTWSITTSTLGAGGHTLTAKASDLAGNVSTASSGLTIDIDTAAPTGTALSATTASSNTATSGATLATLSATDAHAVSYSLAAGNGTNDADNGSFSISGTSLAVGGSSLAAGTYRIYVAATDAAGNVANQAFTITVVHAPAVSAIVRAGGASATTPAGDSSVAYTVTFDQAVTGVDANDFTLTGTGTAFGSIASVSGSGATYTVTVDGLSGDGALRLDLNSGGVGIENGSSVPIIGGYTSGQTYVLDHTAPNAPSAFSMSAASDSGTSNSDQVTKLTTPTFTGTAEAGATVTLYDGATVLGTTTAAGGAWSITPSSALSEGSHTLTAKAADAAGNVSAPSAGLAVTIDTTAPTVAITSDASTLKAGQTAAITFTFSEDPGATFSWDGSSGDVVVTGGALSALSGTGLTRTAVFTPTSGVNGGSASISVAATVYTDAAGNSGGAGTTPLLAYDTQAPSAPSAPDLAAASDTGASNTDDVTTNNQPTFTGTAEAAAVVKLYDTDGTTLLGSTTADGSGDWSITSSTLSAGSHTITARAADAAGNLSVASSGLALTIEAATPPPPQPSPPTSTTTVDGVQVQTSTIANSDGSTSQVVTIPVVQPSRQEQTGDANVADIPLASSSGVNVLTVQLPTGYGLTVTGWPTPGSAGGSLTHLIREIRAHTEQGSSDQSQLTGGGSGFLGALAPDTPLIVQTIVPTVAPGASAPGAPLVISGVLRAGGAPMTALVIDTQRLPAGAQLQLQNVEFAAIIGDAHVTGGEGSQHVWGDSGSQHIVLGADDDELHGGGGDDVIGSMAGSDQLYGDAGQDFVFGGEDNDRVFGGAGADRVQGNQGDDFVQGNEGDDTVMGGQGHDVVLGGKGDDLAFGDIGNDTVQGDTGADTLHGGEGDDLLRGGDGHDAAGDLADHLFGGAGDDRLEGEGGADTLQGNEGQDTLHGGQGADVLHGGRGADQLFGDDGDDVLFGDLGDDTLTGGGGADCFVFRAGDGRDAITDFNFAQGDRLAFAVDAPSQHWSVAAADGGALLKFSSGGSVLLAGVEPSAVNQSWFV
jgi:Ca2+-binding RTX toxin-like protein